MEYNSRSDFVLLQVVSAETLGLLKGKELLPVWVDFVLLVAIVSVVGLSKLPCGLWP